MAVPLGIQQLMSASEVKVKQQNSMRNKYEFQIGNTTILTAKERGNVLWFSNDRTRNFKIDICDINKQEVISLRRPHTFGPDKMEVSMSGRVVSIVRQEATFFKPVLSVNSPADQPVLRIKGPSVTAGKCDYEVMDVCKRHVGVVQRQVSLRSALAGLDAYRLHFPGDLDVRYKAALLGACLLIDFLFYE